MDPISRRRDAAGGFTFPEILVVVSIIALATAVAIPLVAETVRSARIRGAAQQLAVSLRAARMIAVSANRQIDFNVILDDTEEGPYYEYPDNRGSIQRVRFPEGIQIDTGASSLDVRFLPNGSVVGGPHQVVLEAGQFQGGLLERGERWTIITNSVGVTVVDHERVG